MEELQLTLTPARVDQKNFGIQLANWRVGQQLTALVVDTRPNGGLVLSVAGKTFLASSDLPVQPGTRMAMEVKQAGAELVLRRLPDPSQPRADAGGRAAETTVALTSPRPAALLNQLSAQPARFGSPELQEVSRELRGRALKGESATPGDIKRALRDSGLFTEADLSAGRGGRARQSGKASLSQLQTVALALADDLDDEIPETRVLFQIAEKATSLLTGIVQNQLASLPQDDGSQRWVFTLPVEVNERFHDVRFELERGPQSAEQQPGWSAKLNLELPELGAVAIRVQIVGSQVNVAFDCEDPNSATQLGRSMPALENRLVMRDLRPGGLTATAPTSTPPEPPAAGTGLSIEA